jgi:hypothetical protein
MWYTHWRKTYRVLGLSRPILDIVDSQCSGSSTDVVTAERSLATKACETDDTALLDEAISKAEEEGAQTYPGRYVRSLAIKHNALSV